MFVIASSDSADRWLWNGRDLVPLGGAVGGTAPIEAQKDPAGQPLVPRLTFTSAQIGVLFRPAPLVDVTALAVALAAHLPTSLDPAVVAASVVGELAARLTQ